MKNQRRMGALLRRIMAVSLAVTILLMGTAMGGYSSSAFADDTQTEADSSVENAKSAEDEAKPKAENENSEKGPAEKEDADSDVVEVGNAELEGADSKTDDIIDQIENDGDALMFASEDEAIEFDKNKKVKLSYTKQIKYEDSRTYIFKITVDGKKKIAYCLQPHNRRLSKGSYNSVIYDSDLMRKALYYSYGYPGYEKKTKEYLKDVSRKSCYKGDDGAYALFHVLLSYVYYSEGHESKAFKGVSAESKKMIKAVLEEIKTWEDPSAECRLSLSESELVAEWNPEEQIQETDEITLEGSEGNSITVNVPDGVTLVRSDAEDNEEEFRSGESVKINVDEDFSFKAPTTVTGTYKSPEMEGSMEAFSPYYIKKSGRQDTMYGIEKPMSVSFSIEWNDKPNEIKIWTEASETKSGKREFTADGQVTIEDMVMYEGLSPGTEYIIKGILVDKASGDTVPDCQGETKFTPDQSEGNINVDFSINSDELQGKSLVAFEKLYEGDKLKASHEDINDEKQTVAILEKVKPPVEDKPDDQPEKEDKPVDNVGSDNPDKPDTPDDTPKNPDKSVQQDKEIVKDLTTPKTGDDNPLMGVMLIMVISGLFGLFSAFRRI